jgi:hypothetical protein
MDKIFILKAAIYINLILFCICIYSFFAFNNNDTDYFNFGWSKNFNFVSISIDTPLKYFSLCSFIIGFNISEVFLNEYANPLIVFSTYNPYKYDIQDFTRFELELFSNIIYFIQASKTLLRIAVTISQFDIAVISLVSSQSAAYLVIKKLLDQKSFNRQNYVEVPDYNSINPLPYIASNNTPNSPISLNV